MEQRTYPFYARLCYSLVSIVIILILMKEGQTILIPMCFAGLLSILLISPCDHFEKRGIPRGIAALISLLLAIVVVITVLFFVSSQVVSFRDGLPVLVDKMSEVIADIQVWAKTKLHISSDNMRQLLNSAKSQTLSSTSSIVGSTVSSLSSTLLYIVLVPIYTFLLLLYRGLIVRFLVASFLEAHSPAVHAILSKSRHVIKNYIVGLLIEMAIVALLNFAGFFVLGVKYALLLGVIAALLNLIPYLGIFTALVLSCLITFTTNSPQTVLGVAIVLVAVHLIDSNILLPRVVGSKVRINALATILGVVVGSMVWGIPGMFLAVPIVAILKVIFDGVESLQPWGLLLGDDRPEETVTQTASPWMTRWLKRKKKPAAND